MLKHLRKLLLAVMICSFMTCTFLALNKIDAEENTVLGPNLMTNGSFENQINTPGGDNEYELQWGAKVYTATDENDPRVRTGSKSIQLENTVGQENVPFARTTTLNEKITANSEYVLSMYVKAIGYRGYQYLQVFYNQQAARVDEQDIHFANNVSDEEGEWVKLSYRFTLNETFGDGTATTAVRFSFFGGQVTQSGSLFIDDISLNKVVDPSEVEAEIFIDVDTTSQNIGYGLEIVMPKATASFIDENGISTDISDKVRGTLKSLSYDKIIEGYNDVLANEAGRTFAPAEHGYYSYTYTVEEGGLTSSATITLSVMDTLQEVRITNTDGISVKKGQEPDWSILNVEKKCSYSQWQTATSSEYEIDTGSFDKDVAGTYTVKVTMKANSVYIRTSTTVENIPNKKPYTAPDVEVIATDKDGNTVDLYDQVTVTFQQCLDTENGIWIDILGYIDLPISERTFIADMHGYCRAVYKVSYEGKEAQAIINLNIMDTLHGISVKTDNVETVITKGTDLDLRKLIVLKTMSYTGEKTVEPGAYTIDYGTFDKNVPGKYTIKIMYGEVFGGDYEAEFEVEVRDVILSFTIVAYPTRTELSYGEQIDMNGIKAEVVFETLGKQEVPVNEITVKGYSPRRVGTQTVEFYYSGVKGGEMQITVMDAFYAVVADTDNVKLVYKNGEGLDLEGLKVYKIMVSGTRIELKKGEYTVNTDEFNKNAAGTYTIKISATIDGVNKGATFEVTVEEAEGCSGAIGSPLALISGVIVLAGAMLIKKKNG